MAVELTKEELKKQNEGWWSLILFLVLFPVAFFVCAFLPMWMGWAPVFP